MSVEISPELSLQWRGLDSKDQEDWILASFESHAYTTDLYE